MKNTFYIFGLFLLQVVVGKLDDNILGAQGANLMKELKDSGVLDSFEQELEKMLHQEKAKEDAGKGKIDFTPRRHLNKCAGAPCPSHTAGCR